VDRSGERLLALVLSSGGEKRCAFSSTRRRPARLSS
jgi:hypothetical protein